MTSFAPTPRGSAPSTRTCIVFGRRWSRHCVARTCSTSLVPMPNASAPKAPCVEVWLSPHTMVRPGCVRPSSGPMTWTIPCSAESSDVERDAELGAVPLERPRAAPAPAASTTRQVPRQRRRRVVHRREGAVGAAHAQPARAETGEGLRRGHLVDEVQVDVEDGGRAVVLAHDVVAPDLLEQRRRRS